MIPSHARRLALLAILVALALAPIASRAQALQKQPSATYRARRQALAAKLNGGVAILFAAPEPILDFAPYRQDSDFYYLTGWNEPGAALLIVADAPKSDPPRAYRELLLLPSRNLRMEKYTGEKLGADTPNAPSLSGVDEVLPMAQLPAELNKLTAASRGLAYNLFTEPTSAEAKSLAAFNATTLGLDSTPPTHDVTAPITELRVVKDPGEIALLTQAANASIAAQRTMIQSVHPGVTERAVAGKIVATLMAQGCERPSYAPIVGAGINSTTLHYSNNSGTMQAGDLVVVDAAGEFSMYASDITRTVPVSGHFTARQREIYDVVLGAQRAAAEAFVAGKSKILGPHTDPDTLDTVAYNYINTHGKGPNGEPLGKYWIHGLGHMVGIDVHDPSVYPTVLKPGMVFTIEPGVYIPEEKIGVRIEDTFYVGPDGKLIDLVASLPHTADDIEAAMKPAH